MNNCLLKNYTILLSAINFSLSWNLHPWASSNVSNKLEQSFKQVGILHPPILLDNEDGTFSILCGHKRLAFLIATETDKNLDCLIAKKDTSTDTLLQLIFYEQSLFRPLSLPEKARFVTICKSFLDDKTLKRNFRNTLKLPREFSNIDDLLAVLKQDIALIQASDDGLLEDKIMADLIRLPSNQDRIAMVHLFAELSLGNNNQKRFLSLIQDLAIRNGCSISSYLQIPQIIKILQHPSLNTPQKVQHLGTFLLGQHSPLLAQAEYDFQQQVRGMDLPPDWSLQHSPGFEKNDIMLQIRFQNFSVCRQFVSDVRQKITLD